MKNKYFVIGGQYAAFNYGGAATLLGAKRLATKNKEYWDNFQGWHTPRIFRSEDCALSNNFYGEQILPVPGVYPVAYHDGKKWIDNEEV